MHSSRFSKLQTQGNFPFGLAFVLRWQFVDDCCLLTRLALSVLCYTAGKQRPAIEYLESYRRSL